jgi:hypothetical protein
LRSERERRNAGQEISTQCFARITGAARLWWLSYSMALISEIIYRVDIITNKYSKAGS